MKKKLTRALAVFTAMIMVLTGIGFVPLHADAAYVSDTWTPDYILGHFGVVAFDSANIDAHFHSNFIVKNLNQKQDSGLRKGYNITEEFYFESASSLSHNMSELESDVIYTGAEVTSNGSENYVTLTDKTKFKIDNPKNVVHKEDYVSFSSIQKMMIKYNQQIAATSATNTVTKDFSDINNKRVVVTGKSLINVINIDAADLVANGNNIYFEFPDYDADKLIIVNVDMAKVKNNPSVSFPAMILGDKNHTIASAENNVGKNYNKMLFNIYDSTAADKQYSGTISFDGERGFGTVIAPSAEILLGKNWDGTVIANKFTNKGQYHRVDAKVLPTYVSIVGKKTDNSHNVLAGAEFGLYSDKSCAADSLVMKAVSSDDGKFSFDNILSVENTTYYVKEIQAPAGYVADNTVYTVEVPAGKSYDINIAQGADIVNKSIELTISKTAVSDSDEISGAELSLKADVDLSNVKSINGPSIAHSSADGSSVKNIISWTTSANGAEVLSGLPAGNYTLTENQAPTGYKKAESINFTIGKDGLVYQNGKALGENLIHMEDRLEESSYVTITGKKTDENGVGLRGAKFGLYNDLACTNLILTAISGNDGSFKFESVLSTQPGNYYVKEIEPPTGYKLSNAVYPVAVEEKATNTITLNEGKSIVNEKNPTYTTLTGTKVDANGAGLAGAEFGLYTNADCSGTAIATATSAADGTFKFDKVESTYGATYYVKETKAPQYYQASSTVYTVEVAAGTTAEVKINYGRAIVNNKIPTYTSIVGKKGEVDGNSTKPLSGAKFGLFTDAKCETTAVRVAVSGADGTFTFENIESTEDITYYVKEVEAPAGYVISNTIYTVKIAARTTTALNVNDGNVINNKSIEGEFSKIAVSSTGELLNEGKELSGAVLTLAAENIDLSGVTAKAGSPVIKDEDRTKNSISWTTGSTPMVLTGLPVGTYTLTETTTPNGYKTAETITFIVKDDGDFYKQDGTSIYDDNRIVMKDAWIPVPAEGEFSKVAVSSTGELLNSGKELGGAVLTLTVVGADLSGVTAKSGSPAIENDRTSTKISWKTGDAAMVLTGLPAGTYTLTETTKPDGYDVAESIKFVVDEYGKFYEEDGKTAIVNNRIVMKDKKQPVPGDGEFSKVAVSSTGELLNKGDELSGAVLTLTVEGSVDLSGVTAKDGSPAIENDRTSTKISWKTGNAPMVLTGLPAGKYTLTETTAPNGYEKAESITFVVDENGKFFEADGTTAMDSNKIVMEDKWIPVPADGKFSKVAVSSTGELLNSGNELANAKLTLSVVGADLSGVTAKAGSPAIDTASRTATSISWTTGSTPMELTGLPAGTYTLTETTAPDGYAKAESISFVVKEDGKFYKTDGTTIVDDNHITMEDKWIPVPAEGKFSKVAVASTGELLNSGAELANAKLTLSVVGADLSGVTAKAGSPAIDETSRTKTSISWTTGSTSMELTGLPAGTYTLTEVTAPDGYEKAESISFIVKEDGKFYKTDGTSIINGNLITMEDKKKDEPTPTTAEGKFSKVAVASTGELLNGGAELANAKLTLSVVGADLSGVTAKSGSPAIDTASRTATSISWTTGSTSMELTGLPAGTYTLTEVTAPDGYEKAESISFIVKEDGKFYKTDGTTIIDDNHITMQDKKTPEPTPTTAEGKFSKVAVASTGELLNGGAELANAKLTLSVVGADLSGVTAKAGSPAIDTASRTATSISWTTGSTPMELTGLPAGTYTLTEVTAPTGYEKAESISFIVKEDGKFYKIDGTTIIDDNHITMQDKKTPEPTPTTAEGKFSKVAVASTGELLNGGAELANAKLTLSVVGADLSGVTAKSGSPAIDTASRTATSISWTTGSTPMELTGLPAGTYTLTEVTAPTGYEKAESISFIVKEDGKFYKTDGTTIIDDNHITMQDKKTPEPEPTPDKTEGKFSKVAVASTGELLNGGAELANAKLTLSVSDADLSEVTAKAGSPAIDIASRTATSISWTTGSTPMELTGLPAGTYTLTEVTAPDGYEKAESISFIVKEDGKFYKTDGTTIIDDNHITMQDKKKPEPEPTPTTAEGKFSKVAVASTGELLNGGAELANAKLTLSVVGADLSGVTAKTGSPAIDTASRTATSISWTTGSTPMELTGLPAGTYTLTEVTAPDGYEKAESISFIVKEDGKFYKTDGTTIIDDNHITMQDKKKPEPTPVTAEGKFSKMAVAATGEKTGLLEGAELELKANVDLSGVTRLSGPEFTLSSDKMSIKWVSDTTELILSGLPIGTYTLTELKVPGGYTIADPITFSVGSDAKFYDKDGKEIVDNRIEMDDVAMSDPGNGGNGGNNGNGGNGGNGNGGNGNGGNGNGGSGNGGNGNGGNGNGGNGNGGSGNGGNGNGGSGNSGNGNGGNGNGGNGNGGSGNSGNGNGGNGNGGSGNGGNGNGGSGNGGNGNGGSGNGGNDNGGTGTNAPKTGDTFTPFLWIGLIVGCVGCIGLLVIRGIRLVKKEEEFER